MKKTIAIIAGVIPAVSAVIAIFLMVSHFDSAVIRTVINITTFLGFLGFVFFFAGRKLGGGDKTVRILGVLDLLATASIVGFYIVAIFAFGL
ncbi:hypothetical protein [Butyrivibrio sp. INlla16]|uniref:hypothetical protein n=1 Tax=Butyrivibrio sp. INlla16 TaxID=1520807 RepID=UPI0008826638|nr:hypothetical protein [Butyrivibrio sp. INlla16]SDB56395.1 hypothetical protein SAMN02910263_02876 [Butyrivibrio sp. INlla16]